MPLATQTNSTEYTYTEPQSWNFAGADWNNPDPTKTDYWRALALAVLERQDAAGTLSRDSAGLFTANPFLPLSAPVEPLRSAILALVPKFQNWDAVAEKITGFPTSADVRASDWEAPWTARETYNDFPAFASCPAEGATPAQLAGFIREARAILEKLRIVRWRWGLQHTEEKWGFTSESGWGHDGNFWLASAKHEAEEEYEDWDGESYSTVGFSTYVYGYTTQYAGSSQTGQGTPHGEAAASIDSRSASLYAENTPAKTILGKPWNCEALYVANSHKAWVIMNGVEVPPELREYASDNFQEGVSWGRVAHNWAFAETPQWGACPVAYPLSGASLGSSTDLCLYADWNPCYCFAAE